MNESLQQVSIRKDDKNRSLMYFVVRSSLDMSPGKLAAQCCHGVSIVSNYYSNLMTLQEMKEEESQKLDEYRDWLKTGYGKVVLTANENQWNKLKKEENCLIVVDSGLTELEPGTETVAVFPPMKKEKRSKLLKRLQVLK